LPREPIYRFRKKTGGHRFWRRVALMLTVISCHAISHVTSAGEECGDWIYWMYWMYWMYWIYSSHYNWPEKLRHPVTPWFSAEELILWVSTLLYPDIPKNSIRNAKGPGVFTGKKKTFPTMFANILTFPQ